jgi:hypothetical protein
MKRCGAPYLARCPNVPLVDGGRCREHEHVPVDEDLDSRRVPPQWSELVDLVDGARQRGFTDAQLDYLTSVVGIAWAKAFVRGEHAGRSGERLEGAAS